MKHLPNLHHAVRVEKVRYVEDPSSWRCGFVYGFVAASATAAVLVKLILL